MANKKELARLRLERRAARGVGFSGYSSRRLVELKSEEQMEAIASEVQAALGSHEKAVDWLTKANPNLGDVIPLELIKTEAGRQQVREALSKVEVVSNG